MDTMNMHPFHIHVCILQAEKNGKYVVGRQFFVDRHLFDRLLSKNFRRQAFCRNFFVDTTFRRHNTSSTNISSTRHFVEFFLSTQTCRSRIVVKSFKLFEISNYSAFKSWE